MAADSIISTIADVQQVQAAWWGVCASIVAAVASIGASVVALYIARNSERISLSSLADVQTARNEADWAVNRSAMWVARSALITIGHPFEFMRAIQAGSITGQTMALTIPLDEIMATLQTAREQAQQASQIPATDAGIFGFALNVGRLATNIDILARNRIASGRLSHATTYADLAKDFSSFEELHGTLNSEMAAIEQRLTRETTTRAGNPQNVAGR